MAVRIQLRNDSAANWTAANPTLAAGEFGIETDTRKFKVGNGTSAWSALSYASIVGGISDVTGLQAALDAKAASTHTHTQSQITDFAHTHTKSQITDFAHTHNQSELVTTVSDKSAGYTITANDKNSVIRSTGSAITITVANVLSVGDRIDFVQYGAGQITFAASGVTLNSKDGKLKTAAQYSAATVMCVASGVYWLGGDLG